jgi:YtkA-like
MNQKYWRVVAESVCVGLLIAGNLLGDAWGAENLGVTWHHQAAGLTATLITQPSPPRAGENLLRVELTNVQGQPIPHAQVCLISTQALTMPGMHSDRLQEVQATSTHVGVYEGRVHLATPGRWEVIVKVVRPGYPATEAVFYLDAQPT